MSEPILTDIPGVIRSFFMGEMDIIAFRELFDTHPEICEFLQALIDEYVTQNKPFHKLNAKDRLDIEYFRTPNDHPGAPYGVHSYDSVHYYLTEEFRMNTTNVRTASGALEFYQRLYEIFFQYDQTIPYDSSQYMAAFEFALDTIPEYLSGGAAEIYIQEHIIPLYPDTMKKGERKKAIKAAIKEAFKSEKGYPAWLQSSEWPLSKDGKPATYLGKKKTHGGEAAEFRFRDETDGTEIKIEQFY